MKRFQTNQINTWCPGCTNNIILRTVQNVFTEMVERGLSPYNIVAVTDIGCAGKFYDYLRVNGFYALHGRTLPTAFGIKMANPGLKVIGFLGDGGAYAEGVAHLIQMARLNPDLTALVLNNRVFALTTGQSTPITEPGYRGNTTPGGSIDHPFNPLSVALSARASFIARASALDPVNLKRMIEAALKHKGFSLVEIMQPCLTFRPEDMKKVRENSYLVSEDKKQDIVLARKAIDSWDYTGGRIPFGIFYQKQRPTWEESHGARWWFRRPRKVDKKSLIQEFL